MSVIEENPYGIEGVIRNHHYRSNPKLVKGGFSVRIILCSCRVCQTQISIKWYSKIKYACNNRRSSGVINFKYY